MLPLFSFGVFTVKYFRIRPGPEWEFRTYLLAPKETDGKKYLVCPGLIPELLETGALQPVTIYMGINLSQKGIFLTDVPLPDADGNDKPYNKTRREAYEKATKKWIKIKDNRELGIYEALEIENISLNPKWPNWPKKPATMPEAIEIAFKDRVIDNLDHPVMKRLRGEI